MKKKLSILMISILMICCCSYAYADYSGNTVSGVYSNWSSSPSGYTNYNCYGFAIGSFQNVDPGYYCNYGTSYSNMTWSQFKTAIKQDLAARGYTDIQEVSSSYYLQPGERLIAAVSGWWAQYPLNAAEDSEDGSASRFEGHNYHFYVKYMNSGGWYHKFGTSSAIMILKGSNTPSSITRNDEHFTSSSNYIPASCYMSSGNIVYISFQTGIPLLESQGGDKE